MVTEANGREGSSFPFKFGPWAMIFSVISAGFFVGSIYEGLDVAGNGVDVPTVQELRGMGGGFAVFALFAGILRGLRK